MRLQTVCCGLWLCLGGLRRPRLDRPGLRFPVRRRNGCRTLVDDFVGEFPAVIVADPRSFSIRAYANGSRAFGEGPSGRLAEPATGKLWRIEGLGNQGVLRAAASLPRFPGHRAYWFGWYAFFPQTSLNEGCAAAPTAGR